MTTKTKRPTLKQIRQDLIYRGIAVSNPIPTPTRKRMYRLTHLTNGSWGLMRESELRAFHKISTEII